MDVGGYAYHVINRSVGRRLIFTQAGDFQAFERVLAQALIRCDGDVSLLAYCLMGNHWHLVLKTHRDGVLSPFMKWLTLTHTQRYRVSHKNVGDGPIYRGRFKSFVIEQDRHLLTVCRYVERNAARAGLVLRAEDWQWSSLWRWRQSDPGRLEDTDLQLTFGEWPVPGGRPTHWLRTVNMPLNERELKAVRESTEHNRPFGHTNWVRQQVDRFGSQSVLRQRGRPRR